jgi:UDP-N-acetylmuramoyl-L-alanyl-D-glutamate--2,6-diaminopimelate ligase
MEPARSCAQMNISGLLRGLEVIETRGSLEIPVRGISCHSASVQPGDLFVAIPGTNQDGHRFVHAALEKGAVGSLVERILDGLPEMFAQVKIPDARKALAAVAANFYAIPARELTLIGITGTNGKTSTAAILEGILHAAGHRVGVLGTIDYRFGNRTIPALTTTPGPLELQKVLREMVWTGITHVVMEVTSHALDQQRVHGCAFQGAVFTNISRDHLDYHKDMDAYLEAKIRLFEEYLLPESQGGWAVLNAEAPTSQEIQKRCKGRVIWFGDAPGSGFQALNWTQDLKGIRMALRYPDGQIEVSTSLLGYPNLLNTLAACACAWALGIEPDHWTAGLRRISGIPGRFEPVHNDRGVAVVVDYAHTPDALDRVLSSARKLTKGKLICVFGCGGDRDKGKRPMMAQAAARRSDLVVITSDNPRTEPPGRIIEQILSGLEGLPVQRVMPSDGSAENPLPAYAVIEDRGEAIRKAIRWARQGDLVVIAGKGHERVQIVGDRRIPFDDREIAGEVLKESEN